MIARIGESAMSSYSGPATSGAGVAATRAAGADDASLDAASTSFLTTRPPGPLPWRSLRSTPDCAAILRASGDALTRPPSDDGTEAGGGAGALVTAAAAGALVAGSVFATVA